MNINILSPENFNCVTELIYKLQMDHLKKYGKYYALKDDVQDRINRILGKLMRSRTTRIFVAIENQKCVGYILLKIEKTIPIYLVEKYGYISGLYVKEEFRNKDIATHLLKQAEKWFKQKNVPYAELKVAQENSAQEFWNKARYAPKQTIRVKYF
ncbi:hypothetical protein A2688_03300 [Candidatus Daviesbacteria bacterium RIFCSPHIGHO2_01_FULL_38_8]|nr:MAG: hypothetical protein A2688_03300 [Candidatus Daviesbacteria bacterium RIFCSPHIGHO2_01_FULL_38_8]